MHFFRCKRCNLWKEFEWCPKQLVVCGLALKVFIIISHSVKLYKSLPNTQRLSSRHSMMAVVASWYTCWVFDSDPFTLCIHTADLQCMRNPRTEQLNAQIGSPNGVYYCIVKWRIEARSAWRCFSIINKFPDMFVYDFETGGFGTRRIDALDVSAPLSHALCCHGAWQKCVSVVNGAVDKVVIMSVGIRICRSNISPQTDR